MVSMEISGLKGVGNIDSSFSKIYAFNTILLFSFAPTIIKKTSAEMSKLAPDTVNTNVANGLISASNARSFNEYRI